MRRCSSLRSPPSPRPSRARRALAGPAAPPVPGEIAVPDGHKPYLVAHAEGVQIYDVHGGAGRSTPGGCSPRGRR